MQETAEVVAALDGTAGRWVQLCRFRWPERESTMRALGVVVLDVASQDRLEVAAAEDEEPVETLGADGADEPLGVGVGSGCAHGRGDDSDAFAAEHLVERQGELAVAIVDQEPHPLEDTREAEVAGLLGNPGAGRVRRAAREVDAAAVEFDEEQHVEAAERKRLDGEEIAREHARRLPAEKHRPTRSSAARRRLKAGGGKQPP